MPKFPARVLLHFHGQRNVTLQNATARCLCLTIAFGLTPEKHVCACFNLFMLIVPVVTGLLLDNCRAQLTSSQPEGVGVACMDASRDVLYVADTTGYIHAMRMALDRQGALSPVTLLLRVPPAGEV